MSTQDVTVSTGNNNNNNNNNKNNNKDNRNRNGGRNGMRGFETVGRIRQGGYGRMSFNRGGNWNGQ